MSRFLRALIAHILACRARIVPALPAFPWQPPPAEPMGRWFGQVPAPAGRTRRIQVRQRYATGRRHKDGPRVLRAPCRLSGPTDLESAPRMSPAGRTSIQSPVRRRAPAGAAKRSRSDRNAGRFIVEADGGCMGACRWSLPAPVLAAFARSRSSQRQPQPGLQQQPMRVASQRGHRSGDGDRRQRRLRVQLGGELTFWSWTRGGRRRYLSTSAGSRASP